MIVTRNPRAGGAGNDAGAPARFQIPIPGINVEFLAGDAVANFTGSMGIEPCTPCEQRRAFLNGLLAFRPWGNR